MGGDSRTSRDHKTHEKQIIHGALFHFRFLLIAQIVRSKGRRVNRSAMGTEEFLHKNSYNVILNIVVLYLTK